MSKGLLKLAIGVAAAGVVIKIGRDKYKSKKRQYEEEEIQSAGDLIKKYTAFFDRKLVEVPAGPFEGCELKSFSSKLVLDLSRSILEKDVYISIDIKGTSLTVILPVGQSVKTDINNIFTKVSNHVQRGKSDNEIYIIGRAWGCNIEIAPESVYMDDDVKEERDDFNEILGDFGDVAEE